MLTAAEIMITVLFLKINKLVVIFKAKKAQD